MVDRDRVHERLELLNDYAEELRTLCGLPVDRYLKQERYTGRYLVQVAAQTCIDLAGHLIASEGWRAPRDFGDAFTVLAERGLLDEALAGRLRALAGLRNRLVHVYDSIDDERVHSSLSDGLADLDRFAAAIARYAS